MQNKHKNKDKIKPKKGKNKPYKQQKKRKDRCCFSQFQATWYGLSLTYGRYAEMLQYEN